MIASSSLLLVSEPDLIEWLSATPQSPWPSIDDRLRWQELASTPMGVRLSEEARREAQRLDSIPMVLPELTDFLAYQRTGSRREFETKINALSSHLTAMTLAACFADGEADRVRWVDGAANALWAFCELTTWCLPAHERFPVPDVDDPTIDLGAAMRAQELTEALQLLEPALERLHPHIPQRLRRELKKRIFAAYLNNTYWWEGPREPDGMVNNWNAVCAGAIVVAALGALKPKEAAPVVAKALRALSYFDHAFGEAGSLDEGMGYWAYGMNHYVIAAERILERTGGRVDLLGAPLWREVAQFPERTRLYNDTYINFSDCVPSVRPVFGWLAWLGSHLNLPSVSNWANRLAAPLEGGQGRALSDATRLLPHALRNLFWSELAQAEIESAPLPLSSFLPDVQWGVARSSVLPTALIVAIKGGYNAESHNHNDGGSFIVHCFGEAFIDEFGSPTYTRQFFGATRYQNIAARSLGHSVPLPNGIEQKEGREYAAKVLKNGDGDFAFELAGLYPTEAGLESLTRELKLERGGVSTITLRDHAVFQAEDATLATQLLVRDHTIELWEPGRTRIVSQRGILEIEWTSSQAVARVEVVETQDPRFCDANGVSRWKRLWFDVNVVNREAILELQLRPLAG